MLSSHTHPIGALIVSRRREHQLFGGANHKAQNPQEPNITDTNPEHDTIISLVYTPKPYYTTLHP